MKARCKSALAGAISASLLATTAQAAPIPVVGADALGIRPAVQQVHYRHYRHYRHYGYHRHYYGHWGYYRRAYPVYGYGYYDPAGAAFAGAALGLFSWGLANATAPYYGWGWGYPYGGWGWW